MKEQEPIMTKEMRRSRDIHYFVRGELNWDESLQLLEEIANSNNWINYLETEMMLYQMATEKQNLRKYPLKYFN